MTILKKSSLALTVFGSFAALLASQENAPAPKPSPSHFNPGMVRVEGVDVPSMPDAPFSAKVSLELIQTLPDGTTATNRTFNIIARDSHGRTHNEVRFWYPTDDSEPRVNYGMLYDPASRTDTLFFPGTHFARRFIVDTTVPRPVPVAPGAETTMPTIQTEDLGTKSQDGLTLHGTRETKTYSRGTSLNKSPRSVITETWYSPELQLNLSVTRSDLPDYTQNVRVTDLLREEPAESLFEIPAAYRINTEPEPEKQQPFTGGYAPISRVRMGGNVMRNMLIDKPQPVYPKEALDMRLEGTVRLHAIVAKDGTIAQIEIISGHPLLAQAALDAVKLWRYRPTLLNGEAVEVDTTIDVIFSLNRKSGRVQSS